LSQAAPTVPHAGQLSNGPAARPARNRKLLLILAAIVGVVAVAAVGGFLAGHIGRSNHLQSKSVAGDQAPVVPENNRSTASPAIPESARKALARLKRLQAKVEAGLIFSEYSKDFADTWADVKPYLDSQDSTIKPALSATIAQACTFYKDASDAWNRIIAPDDDEQSHKLKLDALAVQAQRQTPARERAELEADIALRQYQLLRKQKNEWIRQISWDMASAAIGKAEGLMAGDPARAATEQNEIEKDKVLLTSQLDKLDQEYLKRRAERSTTGTAG
jgi:hypothetical protein